MKGELIGRLKEHELSIMIKVEGVITAFFKVALKHSLLFNLLILSLSNYFAYLFVKSFVR